MNKKIVKVIACAMSVAMLTGCGKTGDKMSFEFDGNSFSMEKKYSDFIAETVGAGYDVLDVYQFKFYNEDGTYSDRNISKELSYKVYI